MTFVDMGNEFGSVDLSTGVVTPIFTPGPHSSPHGLVFVPTPEPATLTLVGEGFVGILVRRLKRR